MSKATGVCPLTRASVALWFIYTPLIYTPLLTRDAGQRA